MFLVCCSVDLIMQDWTESNEVMVSGEDMSFSEPNSSQVRSQHDGMGDIYVLIDVSA